MNSVLPQAKNARFWQDSTAFSLVEVILALGVFTFALMGLIGLLPMGLSNLKKAIDTTTEARIVQRISNELSQTEYDQIPDFATYYFDENGQILSNSSDGYIYAAQFTASKSTAILGASAPSTNLTTVVITITSPKKAKYTATYTKWIAKKN